MNDEQKAEQRRAHPVYLVDCLTRWRTDTVFDGFTLGDVSHVYWVGAATEAEVREWNTAQGWGEWSAETGQHCVLHELCWLSIPATMSDEERAALVQCAIALHLGGPVHALRSRENGRTTGTGFHVETTGVAGEVRLSCKLSEELSAVGAPTYVSAERRYGMQILELQEYRAVLEAQGWKVSPEVQAGRLAYRTSPMSGNVWLVASR